MIFVHSSFRTSSTFVWSRLRADRNATAYYEIFNETLGNLSVEKIRGATARSWPSKHPQGAPYYLEFLPLLDERMRVLGFDPSMSMERFIPADGPSGAVSDAEADYVRGLTSHAEARGKIPVLTAVRSMGRLPGLKAAVAGTHVLLYRNLFQQWCSYTDLSLSGHSFALVHAPSVIRASQHDPVMRQIATLFPIEEVAATDRNTFYQFVLLHLYCYAHAASAADLVLDVNRLAAEPAYRQDVESLFSQKGLQVDLSQAKQSIAYSQLEFPSLAECREFLTIIGNVVIGSAPSEAGRRFAERALADLLDEHERHDFHAKAIRSALGHAIEARDGLQAEVEIAKAEHEALVAERDAARAASDEARSTREAAQAEQAAAMAHAEAMRLACESARAELTTIRNERNAALTDHDNSVLARRAAEAERDTARAERDALRAEAETERLARDGAEAARAAAEAEGNAAKAERDATRAEAEAARQAREVAEHERWAALAAREAVAAERDAARAAQAATEARHAALLRWSVAFHDSTAASLSWKLTRPLRWLRIGRPKRPGDPPP